MTDTTETVYEALTDARAQDDAVPESAPRNFVTHLLSLSSSKVADGLIDPKLVLSWLLTSLGAPTLYAGLLVPVREAGALLPQIFTAGPIASRARRKWVWAAGAAGQGICAGGMVVAALTLSGAAAGATIVALLAALALSRSICSVAYKDVLGKTAPQHARGTATGLAGSVAAGGTILYGLLLSAGIFDKQVLVICGIALAAGLWLLAGALFTTLAEEANPGEGGTPRETLAKLPLIWQERALGRFILVRGLLTATALAPPFMVTLGTSGAGESFGALGLLVLASAGAALVSGWVWGRLSDRSSRKVLIYAGLAAAVTLGLTTALALSGPLGMVTLPALLFGLMLAYQGVRVGRSTYLVDLAPEEQRTLYTALSNTVIGVILIAGAGFGILAQFAGAATVIAIMAAMSAGGALLALTLEEVQD
ncbi:MFS transporter [Pontivivens ytuae]|uniref:MFS transporter n=1 Tax=Pontivivens ytuae TaxID=2789856 RepID=A0A7S9LPI8_9RHOB|nr:MFS transporter [Pontivivens ytuae]QPH52858.1 MFS transporter [Pontivivens ytuae]